MYHRKMVMKGYPTFPKTPGLNGLISYQGYSLSGGLSYSSVDMQLAFSITPADKAIKTLEIDTLYIILLFWEFFTPTLADGFPLEADWQQVSSIYKNT